MAVRDWHGGKLTLIWLAAGGLWLIAANSYYQDGPTLVALAMSVTSFVITWRWLSAREFHHKGTPPYSLSHEAIDRILPADAPRPPYQITPEDEAAVERIVRVFREAGAKARTHTSSGPFGPNREIHFTDAPLELNPVASLARLWDRDDGGLISMWTFGGEVDGRIEHEILALGFKRLSPPGTAPAIYLRS